MDCVAGLWYERLEPFRQPSVVARPGRGLLQGFVIGDLEGWLHGKLCAGMQTSRKEKHVPQWQPLILTKLTVGVLVMHRVKGSCP